MSRKSYSMERHQSAYGVVRGMCRLRLGAPSVHQTGPRSPKGDLGVVHRGARGLQRVPVAELEGEAHGAPGVHERRGQAPSFVVGERRVRAAPGAGHAR